MLYTFFKNQGYPACYNYKRNVIFLLYNVTLLYHNIICHNYYDNVHVVVLQLLNILISEQRRT